MAAASVPLSVVSPRTSRKFVPDSAQDSTVMWSWSLSTLHACASPLRGTARSISSTSQARGNRKPRRASHAIRRAMIGLARWFDGRQVLAVVHPETLPRWYRQRWRLLWRWNCRHGRAPIPAELQALIRRMAWDHPTWGEERIANDLVLKLGLRISPHTVRTYLPKPLHRARHHRLSSQRWLTFVRKHAKAMVAGDVCIVVAATFRLLRRRLLQEWVPHYHEGRPHRSLAPGIPQWPPHPPVPLPAHRHRIPEHLCVVACPILSGLHHEYYRKQKAA